MHANCAFDPDIEPASHGRIVAMRRYTYYAMHALRTLYIVLEHYCRRRAGLAASGTRSNDRHAAPADGI